MNKSVSVKRQKNKPRLSRDEWLEAALDALAEQGPGVLTIDKLCGHLGVSRGSFYWHFRDRNDFIESLVSFWDTRLTDAMASLSGAFVGGPLEKLEFLTEMLTSTNAGRYDIPIRAWAAKNELAAKAVQKTDQTRYTYVRSLFEELGFTGEDLEMRTRTYVVFYSLERGITIEETPEERNQRFQLRHQLLTNHRS